MKPILKSILALVVTSFIVSCEEIESGIDTPKDYQQFNFHADVEGSITEMQVENGITFELDGNSTSCNLVEKACFYLAGDILEVDQSGSFKVTNGQLVLSSLISDCELTGQFEGSGIRENNTFKITADLQVNCGTGIFDSNAGKLQLIVNGELPTKAQPNLSYEVNINGYLEKK